jgi:integrase
MVPVVPAYTLSSPYPPSGYDLDQAQDLSLQSVWARLDAAIREAERTLREVQIPLLEFGGAKERKEVETKKTETEPNMTTTADWIDLPFEQACLGWLETRRDYIAEKTFYDYRLNIKPLTKFFGKYKLREITKSAMFTAYQNWRKQQVGFTSINHELGLLEQILKAIGQWEGYFDKFYQPLPLPKKRRGRAIEDCERDQLWRIMRTDHNWDALRLGLTIMINSTASPSETLRLKLENINEKHKYFEVGWNGAKNDNRIRPLPFNNESEDAFREAIGRAKLLGSFEPWHYLFPKRVKGNEFDPLAHQVTWRTAWEKVKCQAAREGMKIERLRIEDMRHTAGTALWENEAVSEQTAQDLMGHGSEQMKEFYSHIRVNAKRKAIESLASPAYRRQQLAVVPMPQPQSQLQPEVNADRELAQQLLTLAAKLLSGG